MTKATPDLDTLDAALRAIASTAQQAIEDALNAQGMQMKAGAIVVMTNHGPLALRHGCRCDRCTMHMIGTLGRAMGSEVEITVGDTAPVMIDAAGLVH